MADTRILYLPVETKARELLGKTLLAAKAAERGWVVVIRSWHQISRWAVTQPPGALVVISIPEETAERVRTMRRAGHRLVDLCEENLVYPDGLDYCQRKVGPTALASMDLVLTSGSRNDAHLREFRPEGDAKYRLVGNPRFDTLHAGYRKVYEEHTADLRERYGRFLLVNTNFARINPFKAGQDILARMVQLGQIADEVHGAYYRKLFAYKRRQMAGLQRLLAEIAAAKVFDTIVVRPHPSENHNTWRSWASPLGIQIRYELTANDWLLAAQAILHTGCTTGIEGLLLDRPVACFLPENDPAMLNQADEISVHVADAAEFAAQCDAWRGLSQNVLRERFGKERAHLATLIANAEVPFAADRIVDAIDELDLPPPPADFGNRHGVRETLVQTVSRLQDQLRGNRSTSNRQKFPRISREDIQGSLDTWIREGLLNSAPRITRLGDASWLFVAGS